MAALNTQQRAAVLKTDAPLLVLAGAGSGKTRVITEKIGHLISQGIPAKQIAAITFTNKAAREMRSRVGGIVSEGSLRGLTISTFHAMGLEILRKEHQALKLKKNISIFDESDKSTLIKELIKHGDSDLDPDQLDHYSSRISFWKNQLIEAESTDDSFTLDQTAALLYRQYQRQLRAVNAVDLDDLIFLPVSLFRNNSEILARWHNQIRYLLVDEYQDTNLSQYELIKLLAGPLGRFTVVGDDDQSIYSWRGAQPENLLRLQRDYPRLAVIKLEQNYRSSRTILSAANQLISNNRHIFEKQLWSDLGQGEPIRVLQHKDETFEAKQIASDLIHHKFRAGTRYQDYAILYRGNHQARLFETALREAGVPYFITGGSSFFGSQEIKDVIAYLRLITNHQDDAAFLRIVNTPRREIGPATLEKLASYATNRQTSLFDASQEIGIEHSLQGIPLQRLRSFCELIKEVRNQITNGSSAVEIVESFFSAIGYEEWLDESTPSESGARKRKAQVKELFEWFKKMPFETEAAMEQLTQFVSKATLADILDRNQEENSGDRVNLMTLHASKGLEFPHVYLIGMEEDILPHEACSTDAQIEEERRLAYVGITRAQKSLSLSYCTHRKKRGELNRRKPSRFLEELPEDLLEWPARKAIDPSVKKERATASLAQLRSLLSDN